MTDTIQVVTEQIPRPHGRYRSDRPSRHHALGGVGDSRYAHHDRHTNPTTVATITIAKRTIVAIRRTAG